MNNKALNIVPCFLPLNNLPYKGINLPKAVVYTLAFNHFNIITSVLSQLVFTFSKLVNTIYITSVIYTALVSTCMTTILAYAAKVVTNYQKVVTYFSSLIISRKETTAFRKIVFTNTPKVITNFSKMVDFNTLLHYLLVSYTIDSLILQNADL